MLDPKLIRNNPDAVKKGLKNRKADTFLVERFLAIDEEWRKLIIEVDELKAKRNTVSDQVGKMKKNGEAADDIIAEMKGLSTKVKELDEEQKKVEQRLNAISLEMPNTPHISVPVGIDSRDNLEVRTWGDKPKFKFKAKAHDEIGRNLGVLDFERAAKISGARFVVYRGMGAALERALINFMLDIHIKEHGYTEVLTPVLVNAKSMLGTGQLPKFAEDLFRCKDDDLYLIPTAEVSVTNLHANEIVQAKDLPIQYVCYSPCFRREAGSYGKDVKGIIRQHQFNKVELVKFAEPDKSYEELEKLTQEAEKILQRLGLPYRVVELSTGDLGFASAKTYDLEVWFPSENKYREISSCSNFESFQARRAGIRFRSGLNSKPEYLHTLNGSGLAIGRTFAAILENFQQEDDSVIVPEALRPYLHGTKVIN
ncbi:serine--tRNA ligase [candidate division WOR-1 bacterium RIFCSPLOWO2_02_FULL_46_20]|uniref:Serine--tRNA ligase n=2 Tax=Saganbacteria TaxID=1703751 RepID=A0A1F4R8Z2_UNCSA|nr:MAG: serine--tRNA ligase [candidate division WOR-1 bacterium RIFCSPHIGHO2_02_FULL_45_12]OGC04618.1 MAG: serine--tRNA ligase [candidate division WOR-1 bacterium RIFCSPLOWO2_02_FULL_46_20]OGC08867.1 MAG: serine--tRNA ligase [candidate division WOR-1 bacterium RIFCSPLOWO2_12_FULL_45_9]